jgi:hypothetical protein
MENGIKTEGNHRGLPLRKTFGPPKADNIFGRSKRRPYEKRLVALAIISLGDKNGGLK